MTHLLPYYTLTTVLNIIKCFTKCVDKSVHLIPVLGGNILPHTEVIHRFANSCLQQHDILWTFQTNEVTALRWRHNGHDSVSNHQPHLCLLNRLFTRRTKKTSKLRVTGLCVGNSPHKWPVTRKMFPFDDVIMEKKKHPCGVCYWNHCPVASNTIWYCGT